MVCATCTEGRIKIIKRQRARETDRQTDRNIQRQATDRDPNQPTRTYQRIQRFITRKLAKTMEKLHNPDPERERREGDLCVY